MPRRRTAMIPDLPHELESEILSRVPANFLAKWKTTCKRWYTLFKDPKFMEKNMGNAVREVILLMNHRSYTEFRSYIKREAMMMSDLPRDLESEILRRVPATSVKKLRLTCKRWYALFKDPRFIKKHLGKAAVQMVLKKDESAYSFSFNIHGIHNRYDQFIEFTGKLRSLKDSEDLKIYTIFHCGGLLLCTTNCKDERLVVWNPCTGQTRSIQSSKRNIGPPSYFLGYQTNKKACNSYKILCFSGNYRNDQNATVCRFEMYEFDSDSWRVISDTVNRDLTPFLDCTVFSKGNTYCIELDQEDLLVNCILRFDFTTERFENLPLPYQSDECSDECVVLSVVREEKLALLYQNLSCTDSSKFIWLTNTITDETKDLSWSVFLVVDFDKLMMNGMTRVESFLVDEENKKVMCCDEDYEDDQTARIYVVGEDIHKYVYRDYSKKSVFFTPLLMSYVQVWFKFRQRKVTLVAKEKGDSVTDPDDLV